MKTRTTLILAVLLAALGFWYWASEKGSVHQPAREAGDRVFGGPEFTRRDAAGTLGLSDLADRVEVKTETHSFALRKQAAEGRPAWRFVAPFDRTADDYEVDRLLSELEFLEPARALRPEPPARLDLSQYGLAEPKRSVRFGIGDAAWTLWIGARAPSENEVYVKRDDGETVWVVSESVLDAAAAGIDRYRDKRALLTDLYSVTGAAFRRGEDTLAVEKADGHWRLVAPVEDLADASEVEKALVAALGDPAANARGLRIAEEDFVGDAPGDLDARGLASPARVLTLSAGEEKESLLLGAVEGGKVYAKRGSEPTVFALPVEAVENAFPDIERLRSRNLALFDPSATEAIVIETGGETVVVAKKDGQWRVEEPEPSPADSRQVTQFLDLLSAAAVLDWIDSPAEPAAYGLDEPQAVVRLEASGDAETVEVALGAARDAQPGVYARRGQSGPVLAVGGGVRDLIVSGYLDFLPRSMLTFPMDAGKSIAIARDGETRKLAREEDGWFLVEPVRAAADKLAVESILWDLTDLRARKIVARAPADLGKYGLEAPFLTVSIGIGEGRETESRELRIGKAAGGARYAKLADSDLVFLVDSSLVRRLTEELARRRVLDFDPAAVAAATLRRAGRGPGARIERKGEVWMAVSPEEEVLSGRAPTGFLKAAAGLNAIRVADYRPKRLAPYGLDNPVLSIAVELSDDRSLWLRVGAAKGDVHYVQGSETGFVYEVQGRDIERLAAGW